MEKNTHANCPVATTLKLLSNKWKILIIRELLNDTKRYGELKRNIEGISEKMLSQSLKEMENDKLIIRKVYAEVPPRVEYSLSEIGKTLKPIIDSMKLWGIEYQSKLS
ncbi:winged helix-turn-helix transcriptional regulator [Vagococcus fluvialis]|uniref:MarR family transcriptional regulator n=1 Tax=Vagococcus fluvialis TaxID=2738 RepID=A0A369AMH5_9ENTE|nr:helix-turn-helix domain-containing protein [Vagococcus fluvialis]RCX10592.1 HxlR family transcriptional regulator [Vagococcus fluvialis]RST99396.1 MarR family transcriptional regulator [Vagococcus fluvialis]WNF90182.1 helix-turn-helix domain-containing protein [Vagococcus fluvialis]